MTSLVFVFTDIIGHFCHQNCSVTVYLDDENQNENGGNGEGTDEY